jgi:hypothetical protein
VLLGDAGTHVTLIQQALRAIDGSVIESAELGASRYGPSTAAAVLTYKRLRDIVNRKVQTTADAIVGKMTIASLDAEIFDRENRRNPAIAAGFMRPMTRHF